MSWAAVAQAGMEIGQAVWNAREAEKNRDWQEGMSNTQYQRAAKDMEAAGLNRVLALGSPASTPSGATSSVHGSSAVQAGIMASSAKQQIAQSKAEEALIKQREEESDANELAALENIANIRSQAELNTANAKLMRIRAEKEDRMTPAYQAIGDVIDHVVGRIRSGAESSDVSGALDSVVNSAKGAAEGGYSSLVDILQRIKKWATDRDVRDANIPTGGRRK